jgi:hypothetical protein
MGGASHTKGASLSVQKGDHFGLSCLHLHLSHLADALIQSDLQIGAALF